LHKAHSTKTPLRPNSPGAGGCVFVRDPDAVASHEPALWRPEIAPATLILAPAPDGFDAGVLTDQALSGGLSADRQDGDDRYIILGDSQGDHPIWLHGADAARRPSVILPLDAAFELRAAMMWRFYRRLRGRPAGPLPRALQLTPLRRVRLILLLHALDFRLAGTGLRDITAALIDAREATLPAIEWKSSAARRKATRLVRDSLALMNGGYRKLLRGG
jgi:hypothetical protein